MFFKRKNRKYRKLEKKKNFNFLYIFQNILVDVRQMQELSTYLVHYRTGS